MTSSGMLRSVAVVRANVSEELSASFIRVRSISDLGTTLAITSNRHTLRSNTKTWSIGQSSWLETQKSRDRFPALPDFLSSSGPGTGSSQPL
jgi:hypothetical protein